ncbi:unnamed protein product, partial [Rotaria magnacalcarata]
VSSRKWFSLIRDETCDESTVEKLCITIRSVDSNYNVFEDVVGLYATSTQNASTIVEAIYDVLVRCGLDMINCRGQSYDGASNMSGIYNGVSSIILNQYSKAIYVHCVAHCLDLAVHDLTDQCASVGYCLLYMKDIIDFIRRSPKRRAILKNIVNQISLSYANLTALCPTRWTMRTSSYDSLLKVMSKDTNTLMRRLDIQEALYTISEEKGGPGIKANGLYEQMKKFDFFLGLKLGYLIFTDAEKLSRVLRSTDCCLQDVFCAAQATIHRFEPIQGDNGLELFYDQVIKESDGLTEQPVLPRPRRPPQRYDININSVNYTSCTNYYRKIYVETLESIINLLRNRFTQRNFKLLCEVENFILSICNKPPDGSNDHIGVIIEFCRHDINVEKLKVESFMISDFFKAAINTNQMKIKQITKISTVCEILNTRKIGKEMFQEFDKLIRLYLTIPVTTATAERAFSTLNRVKNALRTSMTQSQLNHCLLAHIYKEKL